VKGPNNAWIVGEKGVILRTSNGGAAWERVAVDTRGDLVNIAFVNDKNGWIVGLGGVILRSSDGGKTWIEQESGTKGNLYGLSVFKKSVWAVGAEGLVLRYGER
jgi:photosystem II stability/assembly factor-like uncharacterized protein